MKLFLHLRTISIALVFFSINNAIQAQQVAKNPIQVQTNNSTEKCGFSQKHQQLLQNDPSYALKRQQEEAHIEAFSQNPFVDKAVKTIPVVVHVIHSGQALGVGANISDAQIISAINNLNAAYSNTSTTNTTYTGLNTDIQFCLAQRDPNGNPHSGINRVDGSGLAGYSTGGIGTGGATETSVKALSKWDNTKYYNFWIVTEINNNDGGSGTQGYAYFPGAGPTVDGSVMLFNAFGYDPTGALGYNLKNYTNRNVTAVHEVGHALNLYHTFEGDGTGATCPGAGNLCGSNVGDCVSDTPVHRRSTSGCVADGTANSCQAGTTAGNYQHNFMDYSSDACQTQFTAGQSTRMNATLTGAGQRASLTLSDGCNPVFANDAGITAIVAPTGTYCLTTFSPQVTLKNIGTSNLTSVIINYNIDGGANQTFNWVGNLASGTSETVTLNSLTTTAGAHNFTAATSLPNGVTDQFSTNDSKTDPFTISSSSLLPVSQGFNSLPFAPTNWSISQSPTDATTWTRFTGAHANGASTACVYMNGFDYSTNNNEKDNLITESISLIGASDPNLTFKLAYKNYPNSVNYDELRVFASTDCGVTYGAFLYEKTGNILATNGSDANAFTPAAAADWRTETLNLSAYIGQNVVLKFEFTNKYGNNLYLDDINITDNCTAPVVTTQPTNKTICAGVNTSYTVANSGGGTYQWQLSTNGGGTFSNVTNGGVYSNATTATLNITGATTGINSNQYRCVITNGCGAVNSNAGTLTVNATPATPTITAGGTTTFCAGGSVVLTSSAASGNVWSTGATSTSITVSTTQNVTVMETTNGCSSAASLGTSVTMNPAPAITLGTVTNPTACLASNGSIIVNGTGTGNISWTGIATGSLNGVTLPGTISNLVSGPYNITFDNGCISNTLNTSLTDPGAPATPIVTASGPLTFCANESVTLTSSSSTGNNWSNGLTTQSIVVNSAGTYTVSVTIAGCTSGSSNSSTVLVNAVPATPTITAGGTTTFCAGGSVVLTSSAASGNVWSTGATSTSITVSTTQNVTVIETTNGCSSAASLGTSVTMNPAPAITLGTLTNPTACLASDGSIVVNGTGTGNVSWTGIATGSLNGVTLPATIPNLASGPYNITYDNGCISNTLNTSLTDPGAPATPIVTAGGPLTFCANESVTLTSSSSTGNNWSNGLTTQSIVVNSAGTYTVSVTIAGCTSGSSNSSTVLVNAVPATPTITAGGTTTFCAGGSVVLTSSAASGNVWSTGATSTSITVSTTQNVTVIETTNGCSSATSLTTPVTMNTAPVITLGTLTNPTACLATDGSIIVNGTGTGNVSWIGAASANLTGVTLPATIPNLAAGPYNITFDDGCISNTLNTSLTDPGAPTTPIVTASGPLNLCSGETLTLTSSSASDNIWSNGETTQSITVSTAGSYSVFVQTAGCTSGSSSASNVTVNTTPASPVITAGGPITFCEGGSVTLTSSSPNGNIWSTGENTPTIVVSTNQTVTVSETQNGCQSPLSVPTVVTVESNPAVPTITADGPTTICIGETINLTSSASSGNVWSTGATTASINIGTSGTYNVTVTSGNCSSTSNDFVLTVNSTPPPTPTVTASGSLEFCEGGSVTLTSSEASGNVWSTNETSNSITVSASGTFSVTIGTGSCSAASLDQVVIVNTNPTVALSSFTPICNTGASFVLNQGTPANGTYTVNSNNATSFDPAIATIGSNTIVYSFTDANNCSGSATETIVVNDCSSLTETANSIFEIFPNPANELINIIGDKVNLISEWKIVDATGREVLSAMNLMNSNTISTSKLANGSYHLILIGNSFEETIKIQILK